MGDTRNGTDPGIPLFKPSANRLAIPTSKVRAALLRSPHFWLYLLAFVASQVVTWQLPDTAHRVVLFIVQCLSAIGYTTGALWSPPREPWTDEQRAINTNKE